MAKGISGKKGKAREPAFRKQVAAAEHRLAQNAAARRRRLAQVTRKAKEIVISV